MVLTACGNTAQSGSPGSSEPASSTAGSPSEGAAADSIVVATVMPFTGENAAYGPEQLAGCYPFAAEVEEAGGVLGAMVECTTVDTADDVTQATTASRQLVATEENLFAVLGPTTNTAPAVLPIFDEASVPMFVTTGDPVYNQSEFSFFWRLTPADDAIGRVLALTADSEGYTRGAAVFGTDLASQGATPTLLDTWDKLGHEMVLQQNLAPGLSYRSEVLALIEADPDVLFFETDPQSSAAYLAELQELGSLIPIVGTAVTVQPEWQDAVSAAIGEEALAEFYLGVLPYTPSEGDAWEIYNERLLTLGDVLEDPEQYSADSYAFAAYDGLVAAALAAEMAGSLDGAQFNAAIADVTAPGDGKTVVYSFGQGKEAIANGEEIQFVGSGGAITFDQWHNSSGGYEARRFTSPGQSEQVVTFTADEIAALAD
jgi:ABC-type branched-subunit amino acid transport system substrate-binding protein